MAKQVQLKQNGVDIYPQTITAAIADVSRNKLLSVILTDIENAISAETQNRIAAINALDRATITKSGEYIVSVSETDGVVSATTKQVEASEVKNESSKDAISAATNVQGALNALADKAAAQELVAKDKSVVVAPIASGADAGKTGINVNIKSGEKVLLLDSNDGLYTDIKLSAVTVSGDETVKEAYGLFASDGTQLGQTVKIYKDQSLKSVTKSGETIVFVYTLADGTDSSVTIDLEEFIIESEFGDGLQVSAHTVSVKKDATSEGFLSISSNGVKISGVTAAITSAVEALDANVSGASTYVKVQVSENDGKIDGVTVSDVKTVIATSGAMESLAETGHLADAKAVKDYVDAKTGSLDSNVSGQTADGFIKVEVDQADGALNYVRVSGTTQAVATADSSNKGLAEASDVKDYVDGQINALDATVSGQSGAVKVQVTEADGKLTGVAVTATTTSMADVTVSTPADNLAKAKDVKDYVDSAATKNTIVDSADIDATVAATGTTLAIKYGSIASGATSAVTGGSIFAWGVTADIKGDATVPGIWAS